MQAATYRTDLRYVQTECDIPAPTDGWPMKGTRERVVGPFRWWFYRVQFWRFQKKFKQFNVLREKRLDAWMKSSCESRWR